MGDVGDYWNDARDYRREQKRKREPFNHGWTRQLYKIADVVELSEHGPHLRVNGVVDFWPSTGTKTVLAGADAAAAAEAMSAIKRAREAVFKARARHAG